MAWYDNWANRLGFARKAQVVNPPAWLAATADYERFDVPEPWLATAHQDLYQRLAWSQIAIKTVAETAAMAAYNVSQMTGEDEEKIVNHPFEQLLRRPNPLMSRAELLISTYSFLEITGSCYWWLNKASEQSAPSELWILPTSKMTPVPDERMYIRGYMYEPLGGLQIPLDAHEVVHFRRFHPNNSFVGLSAMEAYAIDAEGDLSMQGWNRNYFGANNAKVEGALAFADPISNEDWKKIKADVREKHGGTKREMMMLRNAGKGGVQWLAMGASQKDMEFLAGRNFTKEEIYAMHSPGLASILAVNATEANSKAGKATFSEFGVWPKMVQVSEKIVNDILPLYGNNLTGSFEDIRSVDRALEMSEIDSYAKTHTIDEVRARFYQDPPMGDERGKLLIAEVPKAATATQTKMLDLRKAEIDAGREAHPIALNGEASNSTPLLGASGEQELRSAVDDSVGEPVATKRFSVKSHDGAMLAFFLPPNIVTQLVAAQRNFPISAQLISPFELHLTLSHWDSLSLSDDQRFAMTQVVSAFVKDSLPVIGRINGMGRFTNTHQSGWDAIYATFDSPQLPAWRQRLVAALIEAGIPVDVEHGFIPHITLGYVEFDHQPTPLVYLPTDTIVFDALWIAHGDARESYRLEGGAQVQPDQVALKAKEVKALKRWLKRHPESAIDEFENELLGDSEVWQVVKAIRPMPGTDGKSWHRTRIENAASETISAALRKILRAVVPVGTTVESITPESATERYRAQESVLRDSLLRMYSDAVALGARTAQEQVEYMLGTTKATTIAGVNWELVNDAVLRWVVGGTGFGGGYLETALSGLSATTIEMLRTQVAEWIGNGLPLRSLLDALEDSAFSPKRAELIAVTEVTRAYAEGNRQAWRASGIISGMTWQTTSDEAVCPVCGPLQGQTIAVTAGGFTLEGETHFPPAHPRCRCWVTPAVNDSTKAGSNDRYNDQRDGIGADASGITIDSASVAPADGAQLGEIAGGAGDVPASENGKPLSQNGQLGAQVDDEG